MFFCKYFFIVASFPSRFAFLPFSLFVIPECSHQTFTFDGRCYNTCPERAFIVPEKAASGSGEVGSSKSESLSLRKRDANFDDLQDIIGRTESLVKNRAIMAESVQKLCGSCHASCTRCKGPLDSDCVECDADYDRVIIGSGIGCLRKTNATTWNILDSMQHELNSYSPLEIIVISFVIVASLVIMCVSVYLLCRRHGASNPAAAERDKTFSGKYSYDPIVQDLEEIMLIKAPAIAAAASDDETEGESDDSGL